MPHQARMSERHELAKLAEVSSGDSLLPDSAALASRRLGIAAVLVGGADIAYMILYRT
jgi:hypothetical protein